MNDVDTFLQLFFRSSFSSYQHLFELMNCEIKFLNKKKLIIIICLQNYQRMQYGNNTLIEKKRFHYYSIDLDKPTILKGKKNIFSPKKY